MNATSRPTSPGAEEILGRYFPVLDNGFVALIDYMGTDESIEQAARVSYGAGTRRRTQTRGLLRYLRRHHHTTPSEMVELKFHCSMPIFIARQWIRHRTASVNEYSGRYSIIPTIFYTPRPEQVQTQSQTNNQGRSDDAVVAELYEHSLQLWQEVRSAAAKSYEWMTAHDIARELARIDLPVSTYTQWYWKIDLHNLMHFLTLRSDSHAQWEMRQYANVIAGMLKRVAPLSYEAWVDYDLRGARFSRMELQVLRALVQVDGSGFRGVGQSITEATLVEFGLTSREISELQVKLRDSTGDLLHELPIDQARDASFFAQKVEVSVKEKTSE